MLKGYCLLASGLPSGGPQGSLSNYGGMSGSFLPDHIWLLSPE